MNEINYSWSDGWVGILAKLWVTTIVGSMHRGEHELPSFSDHMFLGW